MLNYRYTARNSSTGKQVRAIVQAQTEQDAAKVIREQGLIPLDIKAESNTGAKSILKFLNRVHAKDRVLFARQLSTLINAGLPLVQSLRNVVDQTDSKPFKLIINDLITDVEAGKPLSAALAKHPRIFNEVFVSLIAAGETSGTLDTALERIALQQEKDAEIVRKIRGAMIYPIVVLFVMVAVVVFMLVKVLPQVQLLYTSFPGATLPIETRVLLDLSHIIIKDWWIIVLVVVILVILIGRWLRTESGSHFADSCKIDAPPFKSLFRKVYMARFSRTCSTLMSAGVPLLQVLQITSQAVANYHVANSINKASDKVKGGKSLGDSLKGDPYFLPLVPNMLTIGEQSGAVESMMAKSADYFENEVDEAVKNISSVVEPVMMVLLGVVALIIVAAVLLPVYSLAGSGAINGGGQ